MRHTDRRAGQGSGPAPEGERLQKVLSRLGVASRREAEDWIRAGRLTVNGRTANLGDRVQASDQLRLDGRNIRQAPQGEFPVLLCHRSPGQPLLARQGQARTNADGSEPEPLGDPLAARLPARVGKRFMSVSPMPLVDGGLEILTANGELAVQLQRAVRSQSVEFSLRARGELTEDQLAGIREGQLDSGVLTVESVATQGGSGSNQWYQLVLRGASGNEVHQLLERQGVSVSRLLRTRLGSLALERGLARGQWRELGEDELSALLNPPEQDEAAGSPGSAP
jgi:23S rRNA pseudouridine2605 synthase